MAWWVVVGHLAYVFSDKIGDATQNRSAVDVFIILSGLVIMFLRDHKPETYSSFLVRRAFRIAPAYILVLVVSALTLSLQSEALLNNVFPSEKNGFRIELINAAQGHLFSHFLAHITMLQGLIPPSFLPHSANTLVGQAWSISVEWQFYILAPLIHALVRRGWVGSAVACAIAAALYAVGHFTLLRGNGAFIGGSVHWFAIGIATYFSWKHRENPIVKLAVLAVCAGMLVGGLVVGETAAVVWAPLWLMIIHQRSRLARPLQVVLLSRPLQYLGRISYSTYIVHMLIIYGVMLILGRLDVSPAVYLGVLTPVALIGTFATSVLMYRFVEKPGIAAGAWVVDQLNAASLRLKPAALIP